MKKPIFLADMDNVLVDTEGALRAHLARLAGPGEQPYVHWREHEGDPAHVAHRKALIMSRPGWWEELPSLGLGMTLLADALHLGCEVHVVTKGPAEHPLAWGEKLQWCRKRLPREVLVHVVQSKTVVHGDILMDDRPSNLGPWLEAHPHGTALLIDQPWNQGWEHERAGRVSVEIPGSVQWAVEIITSIAMRHRGES